MRFSLSTLVALGAIQTLSVYAQDCVSTCVDSVKGTVNCAGAEASCVCVSPDFVKGVAECARGTCKAADADITSGLSNGFCVGQHVPAIPPAGASATSSAATTSAVAAATSKSPSTAETSDAASSSAVPPVTSDAPAATPTAAETSEAAETTEPSATKSEASTSATDAANSSTSSEAGAAAPTSSSSDDDSDKKEESSGGGMSGGAKAGVGIGVTIGILALLGIAGFFWKKRQNQSHDDLPRGNMANMSPPMATRDRSYPLPDQGSIGEKHGYDLELMSHRYEDMLPREEPRHMV